MSKDKYLAINFFLSSFGIYLSFFYFGTRVYHYPLYEFNQIIISGVLLAIFIILPIIFIQFFFKKFSKFILLKKIFYSISFGSLIYLIYHYLIRFMDINYYHIFISNFRDANIFFKVLFYLYPMFIFSFIAFFLKDKNLTKINSFILISLIIFNILSINRTSQIYNNKERESQNKNDLEFFIKKDIGEIKPNNKIFILIFDTFDQFYLEKNIDNLKNLKKFYKRSYVNKKFYTPAKFTLDSIPAILTGNSTKKTVVTIDGLYFYNLDDEMIKFNYENSIFNQDIINFSSSIFGFYHPYCRIFNVEHCYDTINFSKKNIKLKDAFGLFLRITYIDRFFNPLKIFEKKEDLSSIKLENIDTNYLSKSMYENSQNFININTDLIFIHYPYPHPPLKIKGILDEKKIDSNLTDYEKNLFLIDSTLFKINKSLESYENSLLIITSDHWYKEGHKKDKAYPSVFIAKIIGDDSYIEDNESKNLSSIKKLINNYLDDKVKSNEDIKSFFKNEKNHSSYVR